MEVNPIKLIIRYLICIEYFVDNTVSSKEIYQNDTNQSDIYTSIDKILLTILMLLK